MVKVTVKTDGKGLTKGTYKAKPKKKTYKIKEWQKLAKTKSKSKTT